MRLDDAGPRTWLLAAAAGWALAAWLLAAAGMGGRAEPLADDPGLLEALPPMRPSPPLRLGPLGQYTAIATRPLFSENRKPQPFFLQGEGEQTEDRAFDYVLTSVLISPKLEMAILQPAEGGESVRVKLDQAPESHPAWRLVGLDQRSAVFEGPEGSRTLELRVYDGVGGERPTAVAPRDPRIPIAPPVTNRTGQQARRRAAAAPAAQPPEATGSEGELPPPSEMDGADEPSGETTEQAQMDAIRARIEARRNQLRNEQKSQPPAE